MPKGKKFDKAAFLVEQGFGPASTVKEKVESVEEVEEVEEVAEGVVEEVVEEETE